MFEPFYQVDETINRIYDGIGLGLSICKGIIINHGGKIWVESKEGKGSKVSFIIPINANHDDQKSIDDEDIYLSK